MWTTVLIYKGCHSFQCFLSSWSICWRCDELRACVECSVFHQYWKHYASAFECHQVMRGIRSELDNRKMFMIRNAAGIHSSTSPLRGRRCAQCRFQSAWRMFKFSNKVNCSLSTSHTVGSMGRLMPTSARWGERIDETNWILYHIGGSQTHQLFSWILNLTDFGQAHADGVGVACRGECPCPSDGDFHLIPLSV